MKNLIYKVSFELLEKDFNDLDELAKEKKMNIADLTRLALSNYFFMNNEVSNGGKILIEDKENKMSQIIFK